MPYDAVKMADWQISEAAEKNMPTPEERTEKLGLEKAEMLPMGRLAKLDFLKIIDRQIPADIVYETDDVLALADRRTRRGFTQSELMRFEDLLDVPVREALELVDERALARGTATSS